jgi:metallo-beta-lactamase family protein
VVDRCRDVGRGSIHRGRDAGTAPSAVGDCVSRGRGRRSRSGSDWHRGTWRDREPRRSSWRVDRPPSGVITFLGGAGTVTGSKFLIDGPRSRVLVDCGLFQGRKHLRLQNREPFPVPPRSIDAVLITHAHLDHVGYLPALVRNGFHGRVYATRGTAALARIVLPDSARLQEDEARHANRKGYSKHAPASPLYTERDAYRALDVFHHVRWGETVEVAPGFEATFRRAGHILGSSTIYLDLAGEGTIAFSGDLGRPVHPVLAPPEPLQPADHVVVESTYGDRAHDDVGSQDVLRDAIVRTVERGGVVVMPAFAVDRTEVILHHLRTLQLEGAIPEVPIYVDSPMALDALRVYQRAITERWDDIRPEVDGATEILEPRHTFEARDVDASKLINDVTDPCIIVSASGMATGGRVVHHLARRLPDPRNTVVLPGFQAPGTRGRDLKDGADAIKMLGRYTPVRAEIVDLPAFSVHADAEELLGWLSTSSSPPRSTFVVHGEPASAATLRDRIARELRWVAAIPSAGERVRLG